MTLASGFVTSGLSRPTAARLLSLEWLHRRRKVVATIESMACMWIGSVLAVVLVWQGSPLLGGLASLALWQCGYVFDCLDGHIARTYGSSSPAGAGVDATADVISMSSVVVASILVADAQIQSETASGAVVGLLVLGGMSRTSGPLWTVSDLLARSGPNSKMPAPATRGGLRRAVILLGHIGDYPLILAATSLLIIIVGALPEVAPALWVILALFHVITGVAVSGMAFVSTARLDQWR